MDLEARRNQLEREAIEYRLAIDRYLRIAEIATKGIITAARAGNVTCRETLQELLPLLPAQKTGA
jgi:hypothetical protein